MYFIAVSVVFPIVKEFDFAKLTSWLWWLPFIGTRCYLQHVWIFYFPR